MLWFIDDVISADTKRKIDEFVSRYPGSNYGPAHIVIDDFNLLDGHIDFCLKTCDEWIENQEGNIDEIEATKIFLQELLKIPEEER